MYCYQVKIVLAKHLSQCKTMREMMSANNNIINDLCMKVYINGVMSWTVLFPDLPSLWRQFIRGRQK